MASHVDWFGSQWMRDFQAGVKRNVAAACIYLAAQIKADISQPGTLRYHPLLKSGRAAKSQKSIYNFTHSLPGNPPYKQTGRLRGSITWEIVAGLIGRVGSNLPLARWLEQGTRRMKARPFLVPNLEKHRPTLTAILLRKIEPGSLPPIVANQARSGYLGQGARKAGYL